MGCLENQSLSLALRGKTTQAVRRCSLTTVLTVLNLVVVLLAQSEAPSLQFRVLTPLWTILQALYYINFWSLLSACKDLLF